MLKEEYLHQLLEAIYKSGEINVFDFAALRFTTGQEEFAQSKCWADQLVKDKLAHYTDDVHTVLAITNFGKYWMIKGGYEGFLKEGQCIKDKSKAPVNEKPVMSEKEKLLMARLKLTHYRLVGFWLALVISSIGFLLSLFNLYLFLNKQG